MTFAYSANLWFRGKVYMTCQAEETIITWCHMWGRCDLKITIFQKYTNITSALYWLVDQGKPILIFQVQGRDLSLHSSADIPESSTLNYSYKQNLRSIAQTELLVVIQSCWK